MKLTKASVVKLDCPAGRGEVAYPDNEVNGLILRVYEGGKRSWCLRFRDENGRSRRLIIGDATAIDPPEARTLARKAVVAVAGGSNPVEAKKAARKAATCLPLFEAFLKHIEREYRPQSYDHTKRYLMKYSERLHREPIEKVTRADLRALRDDLAKSSGVVTANRVISTLTTVWAWGIRNDHITIESNPASYVDRLKETPRDRVLSMDELAAIWQATGGDHPHDRLVRFLMLTAVRRAEGGDMRWGELNGSLWTIPALRMKAGVIHEVTLSSEAHRVIGKRTNHLFVFGGEAPFNNWSKRKAKLDEACGVGGWGLHDFRRSFSTEMNSRGLAEPHIIEAVLAHAGVKSGVGGIYNQASFRTQKAAALKSWAKLLVDEDVITDN